MYRRRLRHRNPKKLTPKQQQLEDIADEKRLLLEIIATGVSKQLKHNYCTRGKDIKLLMNLLNHNLLPAAEEEIIASKRFHDSIKPKSKGKVK